MSITITKPERPLDVIIMDVLNKVIIPQLNEDVRTIAEDARQKLVDKIRDNSFGFAEYSEEYAKAKQKRYGTTEPFLIASEQYINSIQVQQMPMGYTIGVSDTMHFKPGSEKPDILMHDLANVLEYGSPENNIPPRPHWRPALSELRRSQKALTQDLRKKAAEKAQAALKEYLNIPQVKINR